MALIRDAICRAIRRRAHVEVDYRGTARVFEPHSHGFSGDGDELVVGYQVAGDSASGHGAGWKALLLDQIRAVTDTAVVSLTERDGYRAGGTSKNIADVHCCR